jgi:hypothetical protein
MMDKRTEYMIQEALESGGRITQTKGHDQKLIVSLMSYKHSLGNVCLFHMDLVVARTNIKFSKELGATQFIQEVVNERNEKFVFNGDFAEGMEIKTHAPITFFLHEHDQKGRVGTHTRADNTCVNKFLNHFLKFIFLEKGVMIGMDIRRKASWDKGNGMIMKTTGRR